MLDLFGYSETFSFDRKKKEAPPSLPQRFIPCVHYIPKEGKPFWLCYSKPLSWDHSQSWLRDKSQKTEYAKEEIMHWKTQSESSLLVHCKAMHFLQSLNVGLEYEGKIKE